MVKLNNRIRQFRKLKNLSQEDLAKLCNMSQNAISSIELNRSGCSVKHALLIAYYLDCKVENLFYISE